MTQRRKRHGIYTRFNDSDRQTKARYAEYVRVAVCLAILISAEQIIKLITQIIAKIIS